MTTAANSQQSQNPAWGRPGWSEPPFWHPLGMSRPLGIAMTVLGFALWWPVGLALLFFMIFSGRIGCRNRRWRRDMSWSGNNNGSSSMSPPWARWCGTEQKPHTTGNAAFDEYRAETLRRLEEEQTEFSGFLERLRVAKDKAEFDQFMADRRNVARPPAPPAPSSQN